MTELAPQQGAGIIDGDDPYAKLLGNLLTAFADIQESAGILGQGDTVNKLSTLQQRQALVDALEELGQKVEYSLAAIDVLAHGIQAPA